jgi:hypothetical protein
MARRCHLQANEQIREGEVQCQECLLLVNMKGLPRLGEALEEGNEGGASAGVMHRDP